MTTEQAINHPSRIDLIVGLRGAGYHVSDSRGFCTNDVGVHVRDTLAALGFEAHAGYSGTDGSVTHMMATGEFEGNCIDVITQRPHGTPDLFIVRRYGHLPKQHA